MLSCHRAPTAIKRQLEAKERFLRAIGEQDAVTVYVACAWVDDCHLPMDSGDADHNPTA